MTRILIVQTVCFHDLAYYGSLEYLDPILWIGLLNGTIAVIAHLVSFHFNISDMSHEPLYYTSSITFLSLDAKLTSVHAGSLQDALVLHVRPEAGDIPIHELHIRER